METLSIERKLHKPLAVQPSQTEPKNKTDNPPQNFYLKKFIERFKLVDQLLAYSPDEQRTIEESFRLKQNQPNGPPKTHKILARRRGTHSEQSQQIIEEKLEYYRIPKKLVETDLFVSTRKFWISDAPEENSPEQKKKNLFETEGGVSFTLNPEAEVLKHVVSDNAILNRYAGINDALLIEKYYPKRSGSLCNSRPIRPIASRRKSENNVNKLKVEGSSEPERLRTKSILKKQNSLPKIKLNEKAKETLGDSEYFSSEDSHNASMNSTMNTISSQQNLATPGKEYHSPQHKKSRFNISRTTSLRPEMFAQALNNDSENQGSAFTTKSTPKATGTKAFDWNFEDYGASAFKALDRDETEYDSRRASILINSSSKKPKSNKIILPSLRKSNPSTPSSRGFKTPYL